MLSFDVIIFQVAWVGGLYEREDYMNVQHALNRDILT